VIRDGMSYDPIKGQGHEVNTKVAKIADFKVYLAQYLFIHFILQNTGYK